MQNHLKNQTSPYLLQHADNPVNWYPWCDEAFARAKAEDKPIFLSIGYSTCHWCHVMAHESFEDREIAEILNQHFISIKVDKEERPDIDSIYMSVCQAYTGSGGWPTTIFLTPDQKPFFAGTYFPKTAGYGQIGLQELLLIAHEKWNTDRRDLLESAQEILAFLEKRNEDGGSASESSIADAAISEDSRKAGSRMGEITLKTAGQMNTDADALLIVAAYTQFRQTFDAEYGGFGKAPKFPTPHNLLFLMKHYDKTHEEIAMKMVDKTLLQMYRGGLFDHIGGGFSRYSTDPYFLAPHFEKMLYDNALLILAYCKAYQITKNPLYRDIAEKTAAYILREMTSVEGGFYSAQDADSEGVEGKYYLFEPAEILRLLGEKTGEAFNQYYDITEKGNFEGKNIPNLLRSENSENWNAFLPAVYEYRKNRYALHLDDKILTAWNGLMIAAMCHLYRVTGNKTYLGAARRAQKFILEQLCEGDTLYVSYRENRRSTKAFLDDYANEIFALLSLYQATYDCVYLEKARVFCEKAIGDFYDEDRGGFFLYGKDHEQLILRPKETYDGAIFSGNSAMVYNLVQLSWLTGEKRFEAMAERQLKFMGEEARHYPTGHAMYLVALWDYLDPPKKITIAVKDEKDLADLPCRLPLDAIVHVLEEPVQEYPLKNGRTTYYVCRGHVCLPPVDCLDGLL